jgi:hypothetical protein
MSVTLRFITDELGFDHDGDCRAFLEDHGAKNLLEEKVGADGATQVRVNMKGAAALFESLRSAAFRTVDIKGQI